MIKAVDKAAVIETVRLLAKSGGKSGDYRASALPDPIRPIAAKTRAKPKTLMGEVAAPRARPKVLARSNGAKPSAPL